MKRLGDKAAEKGNWIPARPLPGNDKQWMLAVLISFNIW